MTILTLTRDDDDDDGYVNNMCFLVNCVPSVCHCNHVNSFAHVCCDFKVKESIELKIIIIYNNHYSFIIVTDPLVSKLPCK